MEKSLEQLKHIQRISRQTRHHKIYLNQIYDQKLEKKLNNLSNEYEQIFLRTKTQQKFEEQRKQVFDITIQQIEYEQKKCHSSSINTIENNPNFRLSRIKTSCHLFSNNCQLYPCQPIYHYTSSIKKEHDKTLRERKSSSSHIQELFSNIQEKKYEQNHRQLALTMQNQHHLANRHVFMERSMERLNEQSRLLHKRIEDKKKFGYIKENQSNLKQAIQHHLQLSAKFCG